MRKETSNQFTEGMVSDLNPINTPNTVLTDNLNGTIITYNGNEFSLQNDSGNCALKHCKLSPNYIPIGLKEYGDILYIVSYNPLNKNVEIGTYPSPLTYNSSDLNNSIEFNSVIYKNLISKNVYSGKYSDLIKDAEKVVFNNVDLKLNPGDQYQLLTDASNPYKYEYLSYSILDNGSELHDVTDIIKLNSENYEFVPWTVPGSLVISSKLVELSTAGIDIRYFYATEANKTIDFSLILRLNINDKHLIKTGILKQWTDLIDSEKKLEDIKFKIIIKNDENFEYINTTVDISELNSDVLNAGKYGWSEWYDDAIIVWKKIEGRFNYNNLNERIFIKVIPILHDDLYEIEYDILEPLYFNLSDVDSTPWTIGENKYRFKYDSISNSQIVEFDVNGPKISRNLINLYYRVCSFKQTDNWRGWVKVNDWAIGDRNQIKISLSNPILSNEEIGVIEFGFGPNTDDLYKPQQRLLITSRLFDKFWNDNEFKVFDRDITFEDWFYEYFQYCDITATYQITNAEEFSIDPKLTEDSEKFYNADLRFNTFYPAQNNLKLHSYIKGDRYEISLTDNSKLLNTGIWTELNKELTFKYVTPELNIQDFNDNKGYLYNYKSLDCEFLNDGNLFTFIKDFKSTNLTEEIINVEVTIKDMSLKIDAKYKESTYSWTSNNKDSDNYPKPQQGDSLVEWMRKILKGKICLMKIKYDLTASDYNYMLAGTAELVDKTSYTAEVDYSSWLNYAFKENENALKKESYFLLISGNGTTDWKGKMEWKLGQVVAIPFCIKNGVSNYRKFIKNLYHISGTSWIPCYNYHISYTENQNVTNKIISNLVLSGTISGFENGSFMNNIWRKQIIKNYNFKYSEILTGDNNNSEISLQKDVILNISYDDIKTDFSNEIIKINQSNSKSYKNIGDWEKSSINNERRNAITGWYSDITNSSDSLINSLNKQYWWSDPTVEYVTAAWVCARTAKNDFEINENGRNFMSFGTVFDSAESNYIVSEAQGWNTIIKDE